MSYESLRPLIVWLGLVELFWIAYWLLREATAESTLTLAVIAWTVAMLGWLRWAIRFGRRGLFLEHSRWLSNLAGAIGVIAFSAALFWLLPGAKKGLTAAVAGISQRELVSIHVLRLLAIGTIVKYLQRQLPRHFLILGSLPDFLFAISAVAILAAPNMPSPRSLLAWHAAGFFVFLGAGVSMFFSVPSPIRIFNGTPDASLAFKYPMLLAPNFTVPLFMLAHALAILKLSA